MRKALFTLFFVLFIAAGASAQQATPDYQVSVTDRQISADGSTLLLQFNVFNLGAAATSASEAALYLETGGERLLATQTLRPLGESPDAEILTFEVALADIPDGTVDFRLDVGIGDIEQPGSATVGNNTARVGYLVPTASAPRPTRTPGPATTVPTLAATAQAAPTTVVPTATPAPLVVEGLPFPVDLSALDFANPLVIAGVIALIGVGLILLWVLTVILRLVFRPPRIFEVWHPPYAAVPPHDPNTLAGRRQLWQSNAQSDSLKAPPIEGQYHIRKQLVGISGQPLSGWKVRGLRLSQYDIYGRVARSQTLASSGAIRRLDRAARRSAALKEADADRAVRPIARPLAAQFLRNVNRRSLMLPIAIDVRFRGTHGEVRILFELYQFTHETMKLIDRWEPEMTVVSGAIQENFTYTLLGQKPGETYKAFRRRLQQDLHDTLKAMIYQPAEPPRTGGDTAPSQPVRIPAPDTVAQTQGDAILSSSEPADDPRPPV